MFVLLGMPPGHRFSDGSTVVDSGFLRAEDGDVTSTCLNIQDETDGIQHSRAMTKSQSW